jgi:hypothetical protein
MRSFAHIVSVTVLLLLASCSARQETFGVGDEKKRWEAEGWTYFETFGRPREDTVMVFNGSSDAREITAFARTDGVLTNQVFPQTNNIYLVVAMQRPNGDYFSLVFSKPKPVDATQDQDTDFRKLLVGKWFVETGSRRTELSNNEDGTFSSRTTIDGKELWTTSGEWWVKEGQLSGIYRKASILDIPIGEVDSSRLIEVARDYYVIDNRNGVTKKYQRVK